MSKPLKFSLELLIELNAERGINGVQTPHSCDTDTRIVWVIFDEHQFPIPVLVKGESICISAHTRPDYFDHGRPCWRQKFQNDPN